jgi:exopolysaccharide biosynthesis polyprenyl glycosylphosphotransferase
MAKQKSFNILILAFFDMLAIGISIALAFLARAGAEQWLCLAPLGSGLSFYLPGKAWLVAVTILCTGYAGGYRTVITVWDELLVVLKGLFLSFLIVWVILSLQKETETVSRIVVTLGFVCMVFLVPFVRFCVKSVLYKVLGRGSPAYLFERRRGDRRDQLRESLNREWYSGYRIVDNVYADTIEGRIDTCFVPIEYTDETTVKALKHYVENMIIVSTISGLSFMNTEIRTFLTKNLVLITTNNGLLSRRRVLFKRALDILFSCAGLVLLSPFFLIIPVMIKMDSKGPVFFTHRRSGMNLVEFGMIKYRTMQVDSDAMVQDLLSADEEAQADFRDRNKLKKDPRVTRIGTILRRTSLDEIPQFLNVIRGDMSLVGPRPDVPEALSRFMDSYDIIYSRVRPGITGLWQVSGRSDIKYDQRARLDYLYVLNWSIWLDFVIILKTVGALLGGKGAY